MREDHPRSRPASAACGEGCHGWRRYITSHAPCASCVSPSATNPYFSYRCFAGPFVGRTSSRTTGASCRSRYARPYCIRPLPRAMSLRCRMHGNREDARFGSRLRGRVGLMEQRQPVLHRTANGIPAESILPRHPVDKHAQDVPRAGTPWASGAKKRLGAKTYPITRPLSSATKNASGSVSRQMEKTSAMTRGGTGMADIVLHAFRKGGEKYLTDRRHVGGCCLAIYDGICHQQALDTG